MIHAARDLDVPKGWFVGPWNSNVPVSVGFANKGIGEKHVHSEMHEIYLVAHGQSTAVVGEVVVKLAAGNMLVVEPGEVHTFTDSSPDYLHFVVQAPPVADDKLVVK